MLEFIRTFNSSLGLLLDRFFLATLSVVIRFLCRKSREMPLLADDWVMVLGLVSSPLAKINMFKLLTLKAFHGRRCCCLYLGSDSFKEIIIVSLIIANNKIFKGLRYGFGKHIWTLQPENGVDFGKVG